MTLEIGFLFALLAVMVALFLTEKLPVDLTAFLGLVVLVFAGYVEPKDAFTGFSSNAVITMFSVFFVSAALQYTGVARIMGAQIHRVVGSREVPLIVAIMLVSGLLSAFMNNIAAAAVLMPAIASLARQAGVAPSRLMMPLAFGAILGGTTTLVGTPPNLLAGEVLVDNGLRAFTLFEFTPYGLALLGLGTLFMATIGRKLLPAASTSMSDSERADLKSVYRLEERLFSLRVPGGSPLAGQSLGQARLANVLGVQVVAIDRQGGEQLAPDAGTVLRGGDCLVVQGRRAELEDRLELQELEVGELGAVSVGHTCTTVCGLLFRLRQESPLLGRSLRDLGFRKRLRVAVAAIWRDGERIERGLGDQALAPEDQILAVGRLERLDELAARPDVEVLVEGPEALNMLDAGLFVLEVPGGSTLADLPVRQTQLRERFDLTVIAIVRGGEAELVVSPNQVIHAGDQLLMSGRPERIVRLLNLGHLDVAGDVPLQALESADVGLVEAVVAPRSAAVGRTMRELDFRERYGLRALAVWRHGQPIRSGLPDLKLQLGDGLLLHGPREKAPLLEADPDFVVLSGSADQGPHRPQKALFALGALLMMVVLVVSGLFPIQVAAFAAASLVVLTGALKMQEAYRAVEWRAVFLVAAILPVGTAMERTGAAALVANSVSGLAGSAGPQVVLVALMVLSSLLSQGLDGAPTVVLLGPVVVTTAQTLGLSPYPLMMAVSLAASAAFMTPFSHKANLLVMGAGGYRAMDYMKVGAPLTLAVFVLLALMIPLLMPF
jgi:di/tricarboxylate transporter